MAVKNYGIHDQWTNLETINNIDIKSVDGVVESVKINGEEAGGGGGGVSIANVVLINNTEDVIDVSLATFVDGYLIGQQTDAGTPVEPGTLNYQTPIIGNGSEIIVYGKDLTIDVTGAITGSDDSDTFYITGDCTITIS